MLHERSLIDVFVIKERQERYINLIATEKGRKKIRTYISHFKDLDSKFVKEVNILQASELYRLLKSKNAPEYCYVIAEHSDYDMKTLPLKETIEKLFDSGISFFLSCIPGKLIYYEGEGFNRKFILLN